MKVFVTGGAGFIGSHIAEALFREGARVVVLDDLSAGNSDNLTWGQDNNALQIVKGSILDRDAARAAVSGCDWVFHQAAITSVPQSVADPLGSNAVNLDATLELLVAARDAGVKRFMFASSAAVYGDSESLPKREDTAVAPVSPYGLQKYGSERYAQLFHRHYGLETVCFRYFNVFGPRQAFDSPYSGVIAKFCATALEGGTPTVFGDGTQTRDFVYVENVVRANILAAQAPAASVAGCVFNVGGGESVSLLRLLEELERLTGQSLKPKFAPGRAGDIQHSAADIARIRDTLNLKPGVPWQEGLRCTLDWYRRRGGSR